MVLPLPRILHPPASPPLLLMLLFLPTLQHNRSSSRANYSNLSIAVPAHCKLPPHHQQLLLLLLGAVKVVHHH
jgi:hypothetical protein